MSNLTNLIQDLLVNAVAKTSTSGSNDATRNRSITDGMGGLGHILGGNIGNVLGNVLGGQSTSPPTNASQQPGQQSGLGQGGLTSVLSSILGGLGNGGLIGQNRSVLGGKGQLLLVLIPFILNWIQQQGGFKAALEKFNHAGLGQQVNSWTSNGENQAVQPAQLASVIPQEQLEQVAQQANTSTSEVYDSLATLLPQVVNAITPNGQAAGNGSRSQIEQVMNIFNNLKN